MIFRVRVVGVSAWMAQIIPETDCSRTTCNETPSLNDEVLIAEELAKILKIHPKTVYALAKQGKIPGAAYFGGSLRIHGPTVLACLKNGQVPVSRRKAKR